ncbi:MAG: flagellar basal body protein [Oscillospiraceae bacterium]|nr:flagellar basal body protein [Oscillospiraceae bacterium]
MAVIGTFSSFTTARLAIYASQASLNVTGNNIANINTPGYTRQRMDLVSLYSYGTAKFANIYNTNIGYGVLTNGASQLRDPYLDIRYRDENTKLEQNSEWLDGLNQMSRILDEVGLTSENDGFGVIEAQLGNLKDALQKLANQESFQEPDTLVRSEAETLTKYFKQAAQELETIYNNKKLELDDSVKEVNKLLTDIRDLNDKIRTQSIYGDKALELRDARNLALDKLSGYMNIDVTYSMERIDQFTEIEKLTVTIAGSKGPDGQPIKLVDGIYGGQISIPQKEPVMNPNADASKILAAMDKAQADAEAKHAKDQEPWKTDFKTAKADAEIKAKKDAEDANPLNTGVWAEKIAAAEQKAREAAEKKYPVDPDNPDPDRQQKIDAEVKAAGDKIRAQRDDVIQEAVDTAVKAAEREVESLRQAAIKAEVANSQDVADAINEFGKYLTVDANGNTTGATNELYKKDGSGVIQVDEKGNPIYADNVKVYDNDKFIIQVEPLKDERDRLMVDPNTASKRSETVELGDNVLSGKIQGIRELLTEEGEYSSKQDLGKTDEARLSDDPNAAIKRGIPYYQKALDSLARQIANEFNKMNQMDPEVVYQTNKSVIDADGNPVPGGDPDNLQAGESVDYTFLDKDKNPLQVDGKDVTKSRMDALQETMDEQKKIMNSLMTYPRDPYITDEEAAEQMADAQEAWDAANEELLACKQAIQDNGLKDPLYEHYNGGVLFSNGGNNNDPNNITASNISIAIDWAEGPVRVLRTKQPDFYDKDGNVVTNSSRFDNITDIIENYDKQLDYLAQEIQPDAEQSRAMFHGSFREVFTAISAKLGTDQYATAGKVSSYELMTLDLDNDRMSVSGVDLNDEATSMMQFSKSYAAACKLLTTLDSMLDKLINGTI